MFGRKREKHTQLVLSGISIDVTRKKVKNLNIRVYPPSGKVKISVPWHTRDKVIEEFAQSRLDWIQKHLSRYKQKPSKTKLSYLTGEKHPVWGEECSLEVFTKKAKPEVRLDTGEKRLRLIVRPGSSKAKRAKVLKEWYRAELKREIPKLIEKWEGSMGVSVNEFGVKQMKTRWGTCNIQDKRIWLNLELAKKSPDCLEYVVVHEMVHLLECLHNKRFYGFMDRFLPEWREIRKKLNGRVD